MRKIAATYIFPGTGKAVKNGVLVLEDNGTVMDILEKKDNFREEAGVEFYSGVLVPGFINAHCHLELSHLQGKIEEKTGMAGFLGKINHLRSSTEKEIQKAMQVADRRMWAAGIAAVGDISNSANTVQPKLKSRIVYHTFVEAFGFHPSRAERAFEMAVFVKREFHQNKLSASIVPHSPYSVSDPLFEKIEEEALKEKGILSIHNQESKAELQFFEDGTGPISDHFQQNIGIDISHWQADGKSALERILEFLPAANKLLLVHNTFTKQEDIDFLKSKRSGENTFLVLCPNSNLYIENALPQVPLFQQNKLNLCLGTDSLASNHQLSILREMITLQEYFPKISLEELVAWACLNGARALGIENEFGSFEKGKKPGVNLVSGLDLKNLKLTRNSKVKRLL